MENNWRWMTPGVDGFPFFGKEVPFVSKNDVETKKPQLTGIVKAVLFDLQNPKDVDTYGKLLTEFIKPGNTYRYEEKFFEKDGTVKVLVKYVKCFMVMLNDVAEAYEKLDEMNADKE